MAFANDCFSGSRCWSSNFTCNVFGRSAFLPVLIAFSHFATHSTIISSVSLLGAPRAVTCAKSHSCLPGSLSRRSSILLPKFHLYLFLLRVRYDTNVPCELSLICYSLSLRKADVVDKGRGRILLLGVGLSFTTVPIVDLAFATLGVVFAELDVMNAFAWRDVVEADLGGDIRATLPGLVAGLGLMKLVLVSLAAISALRSFLASSLFPPGASACGCWAIVLVPDAFAVALVSTPLPSDDSSPKGTSPSKPRR